MNAKEKAEKKEITQNEKKLTEHHRKTTKTKNSYIVKNTNKKSLKIEKSKYIQKRSV